MQHLLRLQKLKAAHRASLSGNNLSQAERYAPLDELSAEALVSDPSSESREPSPAREYLLRYQKLRERDRALFEAKNLTQAERYALIEKLEAEALTLGAFAQKDQT